MKLKPEKNSGLNETRAHDLSDTGAVLYHLSYQANWELLTLCVRKITVDGEDTSEYMKDHISGLQRLHM